MRALLQAATDPTWPARPVLVISNRPDAPGLAIARDAGIATATVDHAQFAKRQDFEAALTRNIEAAGAEFVVLAGFMRVLTETFVSRWAGRLLNIHPSLLPKYPGLHTHQRCLDAGDAVHGCTVHFVTAGVDEGPIVGQAQIAVKSDDTADSLASRVLAAEHLLYPLCVAAIARGAPTAMQRSIVVANGESIVLMAP